ncbi:hypothetical protein APY03_4434 [Variovorax sp. WDL1]|nr:hypothetical protein APY03_4434 [Variovorax sp. WDL1]
MAPLGWTSNDMLTKCTRELVAAKLLHQTVVGHRPNKAAWFAVTWLGLDRLNGFDHGAAESFVRGAYKHADPLPSPKPSRAQMYDRWRAPAAA